MIEKRKVILIDKEELNKINFTQKEVLFSKQKIEDRKHKLTSAMMMKKDGDAKVTITFKTKSRGYFKVIAPVLMMGKDFIELKGGQIIPVKSIRKVTLLSIN